jgi:hypothetical protein
MIGASALLLNLHRGCTAAGNRAERCASAAVRSTVFDSVHARGPLLADFNTRYAAMGKPRLYSQQSIYSAAIVTGAVTLALSTHSAATPRALYERLCKTAKDLGAPGNDPVFGCGLLQMHHVLSASR